MPTTYTSLLGLALPTTGELSGTWGDTVNNYITQYVDAAVEGTQTISGSQTAVTLSVTNGTSLTQAGSGATGSAQYAIINCTGNPGGLLTITVPASSREYIVINSTSTNQSVKIVGVGPTTGVTLVAGEKAIVAWNGSDFIKIASTVITNLTGTLGVANGGTGLTSGTSGGVLAFTASGTLASSAALASNALVVGGGAGSAPSTITTGTGVTTALGINTGSAGAFVVNGGALGTPASGTLTNATGLPLTTGVTGTLPVANGGTGLTSTPANGALDIGNGTGFTRTTLTQGSGVTITNGAGSITISATGSGGTVTSVGWTGGIVSVANSTTTPAFTIAGTSGGIPYFNSGTTWASSAALAANALVIGGGAGAAPATTTTGTGVLTALGVNVGSAGAFTTNNAANTFTALQTFSGSTSVAAMTLANAKEVCTVSATAATGTINYDVTTQSVLYYTSNASANWTVNFRGSSGTSLNTLMNTGESITVAFLVTQGATPYYNNAVQVDGNAVTPKYQGGSAWTAGNASSIDAYVYTIVKTASATFTVFASQTQFK